jgi:tetratricopeptide (TPR) repeat protein
MIPKDLVQDTQTLGGKESGDAPHAPSHKQTIEMQVRILQEDPNNSEASFFLGLLLHQINENEKAEVFVSQAIALGLKNFDVYRTLGGIYTSLERFEEASFCENKAMTFNPDYSDGYYNIGCNFLSLGNPVEAIESFLKAVSMKPDHYTAHNNLGLAYHNRKMFKDAIESFNNALKIKPGFSLSYLGIGNTLREMGQLDAAVTSFQKAIAIDPTFSEAHNNLGLALMDLGLHESAISSYNTAKNQTPDSAEVRKNIGIINLLKGNFKIGWEEYSWRRFEKNTELTKRIYSQPLWNGEDLNGKTIFVYTEQGFGDTIQFVRYLDLLREQGGRVVLDAQLSLVPLLEEMESINVLLKENDLIPPFDFHVPLMELPRLFSTNAENIPAPNAYLMANEELVEAWKERLGPKKGYRVGIVWAGSPTHQDDYNRSMMPELFIPLTKVPGVSVFSFLVGRKDNTSQIFDDNISDLSKSLTNFAETAAAITNMDLVISVDTAVVHLAGALGKPVWTLLQFNPDWRWMLDRNDSPWYSSMKLFRQEKRQDWQSVIERVTSDLRTLVK